MYIDTVSLPNVSRYADILIYCCISNLGHNFFLNTTSNLFPYFKSIFFIPSYIFMILPGFVVMHERLLTFRPEQSLPPQ